ncbi:epoxide hydrolase family protein [Rhodococcus wratislaviensis]|uniref:epoxide hydrolase family protein n=1 Tax=Rhodococcus wratislaviensis TaxID=44752 RepID=UPI001142B2DB|nr:epoxide hydrolase [Rhodococcus sp. WS4]
MAVRPYTIAVPEEVLVDLKERLARTRWPEKIEGAGWDYGTDVAYLRELCDHWAHRYDWRDWERRLNNIPGYVCEVDGVDLHFWHVRGTGPNPTPLLLLHGWPGSIVEFLELIGPLTDPAAHGGDPADSFDVVVPELPGFGFSGAPRTAGWSLSHIASVFNSLMVDQLGYDRYAVQGGDFGGLIASRMGAYHSESVLGIHLNLIMGTPPAEPGPEDLEHLERYTRFSERALGYLQVQNTTPDSLMIAQSDSPAGLASWIIEKFRSWSDCGGDIESSFDKDLLLTNLMFYWAPNSAASAARLYYETSRAEDWYLKARVELPVAYAEFPHENFVPPRTWVDTQYDIARWTTMPSGGHFAALEEPQLLLDDVRTFFRSLR